MTILIVIFVLILIGMNFNIFIRIISFILGILGLYYTWTIIKSVKDQILNSIGVSSTVEGKVQSISRDGIIYSYNYADYDGSYVRSDLFSTPKNTISLTFLNRNPSKAHIKLSFKEVVSSFICKCYPKS